MIEVMMRRRGMAEVEALPTDIIMTKVSNAPVLAVCHAQGWCANANYMTATEAALVSDISTAFQGNTAITHFEELEYFTGITSIPSNAFNTCTKLENFIFPPNITTIGYRAFYNCTKLDYHLVIPEGVTTFGDEAFRKARFRMVYIPSTLATIAQNTFRDAANNGLNKIVVINRSTQPTGGNSYAFGGSSPKWRVYVPVGATANYPIKSGVLMYNAYVQSVSEIPSTFDTSSRQAIINSLDALDAIVGGY